MRNDERTGLLNSRAAAATLEADRLAALQSYDLMDTAYETSFDSLVQLAAKVMHTPISLVNLLTADRQLFKGRYGVDMTWLPREHAFCNHAIKAPSEPLVVADARLDPRFVDNPYVVDAPNIRFYAGVSLVNPEGAALGTLCVVDQEPHEVTADQMEALDCLGKAVMTTLELGRAMQQVRRLAFIDPLTELMNRRALLEALERTIAAQCRHGGRFALLYLDLDGLKKVNDRLGHAAGDEALKTVGRVLKAIIRREDTAARLGGDEFAVVLTGGGAGARVAAERIRATIAATMIEEGWPVTASVGAVAFNAAPTGVEAALAAADQLMYAAKAMGGNRVLSRELPYAWPPRDVEQPRPTRRLPTS